MKIIIDYIKDFFRDSAYAQYVLFGLGFSVAAIAIITVAIYYRQPTADVETYDYSYLADFIHEYELELREKDDLPYTVNRIDQAPLPGDGIPDALGAPADPLPRGRISSPFGPRRHPSVHGGRLHMHTGVDIVPGKDSDKTARAVWDGTVSNVYQSENGGNVLVIEHSEDVETIYAHLCQVLVKPGEHVNRRDAIGVVGSTGKATGLHLHFELRVKGAPVNPDSYVPMGGY